MPPSAFLAAGPYGDRCQAIGPVAVALHVQWPLDAEPAYLTWRSPNDLVVTLFIDFPGEEDPPVAEADKLGLLTVFIGERDEVESDIRSTADTHG